MQTYKVFLNIVHGWIYQKYEDNVDRTQLGFQQALYKLNGMDALEIMSMTLTDVNMEK